MKAALILDPAHGINVKGKASPDKRLEEWEWSRERIHSILAQIANFKKDFVVKSPFLQFNQEPGLHDRVDCYNEIASGFDVLFMLSIHVDAAPERIRRNGWADNITGTTIFTSRGETEADNFAASLGESIRSIQPDDRYRFDYGLGEDELLRDLDRERNFTVIYGYRKDRYLPISNPGNFVKANYNGVLIENGFMTSHTDLDKLLDPLWCENREAGIVKGIMNWFHKMGLAPKYL